LPSSDQRVVVHDLRRPGGEVMIKIIETTSALSEDRLNHLETQGLTLISANCVVTSEYGKVSPMGMSHKHDVTKWTYHFRRDPNFVAPGEFNG